MRNNSNELLNKMDKTIEKLKKANKTYEDEVREFYTLADRYIVDYHKRSGEVIIKDTKNLNRDVIGFEMQKNAHKTDTWKPEMIKGLERKIEELQELKNILQGNALYKKH